MQVPRQWRLEGAFYRLEGTRCTGCGDIAFPPREVCRACGADQLEKHRLGGQGEVYSFTRIYAPPAGSERAAPYDVALIRLDEGPLVTARLTDVDLGEVAIGDRVEMVTRRLGEDGSSGVITYGFAFRPAVGADPQPR